jgi:hypothetical protein
MSTTIKEKFFAQYFGQNIIYSPNFKNQQFCITYKTIRWVNAGYFIKLKPLSEINDEDAAEIQRITGTNHLPKQPLIYACLKKSDAIPVIDYLRSKGYAVPFMEYSVDDLISFGWVKLIKP